MRCCMRKKELGLAIGAIFAIAGHSANAQEPAPAGPSITTAASKPEWAPSGSAAHEGTSTEILLAASVSAAPAGMEATDLSAVVVTAERLDAYKVDDATAGTKIAAPLRDIPQSIQVLSREMIQDQGVFRAVDLVQNVSGVFRGNAVFGDNFIFRGFSTSDFLRDGYPDRRGSIRELAGIERLEVLKGPASVLYGRLEPGGTLNYVTKQPLANPLYSAEVKADTEGLLRSTVDISTGNPEGTFGVRFNGAYEHGPNFRDYSFSDRRFGSAVAVWKPGEDTRVSVEFEALNDRRLLDRGVPRFGAGPANIPVRRLISEPDDDRIVKDRLAGYTIEHRLSDAWQLKHAVRAYEYGNQDHRTRFLQSPAQIAGDPNWDGFVNRDLLLRDTDEDQITAQVELIGDVEMLGMRHQLLVGIDLDRARANQNGASASRIVASNGINIFAPVYGNFVPVGLKPNSATESEIRANAVYAQDLIELAPQWKLLVGARYDQVRSESRDLLRPDRSGAVEPSALSPRAGVVWQPSEMHSLYSSYSESFVPVIGQTFDGDLFDPTTGKQAEVGIKSEWFGGRLGASLAAFKIIKGNLTTDDPVNDGFSIQTGEVQSEGIEFDIQGSPMRGLNLIGNLAYADVQTTQSDTPALIGRAPPNTPSKGGGLRVSYEVQNGRWRDLGASFGVHYVGERSGDDRGTFLLPSYSRWDAGLSYRPGRWWVALNVENLFDKTYYISAHNTLGIYPSAPRAATLTIGFAL